MSSLIVCSVLIVEHLCDNSKQHSERTGTVRRKLETQSATFCANAVFLKSSMYCVVISVRLVHFFLLDFKLHYHWCEIKILRHTRSAMVSLRFHGSQN